jgi:hypothetical protein
MDPKKLAVVPVKSAIDPPKPAADSATGAKQRLIDAVRAWIHMDNLVETHTTQAANARTLKNKHETDAIALMKEMRLDKSTIQVSGASLTLQKKSHPAALTWGYFEKEAASWAAHARLPAAQAQSLIKWMHDHRETKETESLKKANKEQLR